VALVASQIHGTNGPEATSSQPVAVSTVSKHVQACPCGADAMKFGGWQRLTAEYTTQFGIQNPG
jgi:hypothetical protein